MSKCFSVYIKMICLKICFTYDKKKCPSKRSLSQVYINISTSFQSEPFVVSKLFHYLKTTSNKSNDKKRKKTYRISHNNFDSKFINNSSNIESIRTKRGNKQVCWHFIIDDVQQMVQPICVYFVVISYLNKSPVLFAWRFSCIYNLLIFSVRTSSYAVCVCVLFLFIFCCDLFYYLCLLFMIFLH